HCNSLRDRLWRLLVTFLRVIRTLVSTKFITSSFWHRCWGISILNNFTFNFLDFLNYFYLFIFILLYSKKIIVLNFQFHCCLDLCFFMHTG
ncbi:MAG: hypothetical protein K6253_02235, partial [Candidatus Liberibacter asiaticus]|nr:hypothetical protein [Candidatus Liberibacter asiaticus]